MMAAIWRTGREILQMYQVFPARSKPHSLGALRDIAMAGVFDDEETHEGDDQALHEALLHAELFHRLGTDAFETTTEAALQNRAEGTQGGFIGYKPHERFNSQVGKGAACAQHALASKPALLLFGRS